MLEAHICTMYAGKISARTQEENAVSSESAKVKAAHEMATAAVVHVIEQRVIENKEMLDLTSLNSLCVAESNMICMFS